MHYRYTTIIFGLVASPFILDYIIPHYAFFCTNLSIKQALFSKLYVDNYFHTCHDIRVAIDTYKSVKAELGKGNYCLREWCSNNARVQESFAEEDKTFAEIKLLGYLCVPSLDCFIVGRQAPDPNACSKRQILSCIAKIYDSLGL